MKAKEFIIELKKESKPRNFVAKNASLAGKAGQHKDKKKAEKQGDVKHKKELATMESALSELSTDKLAQYKKAAGADAKKADADGDYARGDKRFKGINRATNKQFDNDLKKHGQQGVAEGLEDKIKQLKQDYATAVHWSKNDTNPHKREAARRKAEKIKAHLEKQYQQGVAEARSTDDPFDDMVEDYLDWLSARDMFVNNNTREEEKASIIADLKSGVVHPDELDYAMSSDQGVAKVRQMTPVFKR